MDEKDCFDVDNEENNTFLVSLQGPIYNKRNELKFKDICVRYFFSVLRYSILNFDV